MAQIRKRIIPLLGSLTVLTVSTVLMLRGQQPDTESPPLDVEHSECALFGPKYQRAREIDRGRSLSRLTNEVVALLPKATSQNRIIPGGSRTDVEQNKAERGAIDGHLFDAMREAGVEPAASTNDFEFIRRAHLDLIGRIPAPERVVSFVNDTSPDRRAKLIDELLNRQEWIDKWSLYFGDLFQVTATSTTTSVVRYAEGRNAFYLWIKQALRENRPYNRIASDIIAAEGTNSYETAQGHTNWIVNGLVSNGPVQDAYDQQAANVADTFLGLNHMNCVLCHNGRGHLDSLSLWGKNATRTQAWGMAAYMAKTVITRVRVNPELANQPYYYQVVDASTRPQYTLNTLTGNRPARCANGLPPGTNGRCAATATVTAEYMFTGTKPAAGEGYRAALAREITSDFQFARATVNYIWKEFFGRGIVDPVNQFDPARLDPENPPPAPWTLQPSNARLLNALARDFISSGYDLKALMRQIANSDAYQLSSRYAGEWNPAHERLFARKLIRRLWAEEIHDAVVQSSNIVPSYNIGGAIGRVSFAMQLPELRGLPDNNGRVTAFLNAFLRGNRDDEERRPDGSLSQALAMMNDPFVMTRIRASGTGANSSLLQRSLPLTNDQLVETLYLAVLSRYPTAAEIQAAKANLASGNRTQKAENLLWSLYNKVDFLFNY